MTIIDRFDQHMWHTIWCKLYEVLSIIYQAYFEKQIQIHTNTYIHLFYIKLKMM